MRLKEASRDVIKGYKRTKIQMLLDEFLDSGMDCAELVLEEGEYKRVGTAYNGVRSAIDRMKLASTLNVRTIGGKLYLFRIDK